MNNERLMESTVKKLPWDSLCESIVMVDDMMRDNKTDEAWVLKLIILVNSRLIL